MADYNEIVQHFLCISAGVKDASAIYLYSHLCIFPGATCSSWSLFSGKTSSHTQMVENCSWHLNSWCHLGQ